VCIQKKGDLPVFKFKVFFYKDTHGREPILEYMRSLERRKDKESRIKVNKIKDYIIYLRQSGTAAGEPYIKHIDGEIWELRPIRDRIFFAAGEGDSFILLHYFMKKTRKTPQKEIDQAKRNLADHRERKKDYEKKDV
jgi:phage-related protein